MELRRDCPHRNAQENRYQDSTHVVEVKFRTNSLAAPPTLPCSVNLGPPHRSTYLKVTTLCVQWKIRRVAAVLRGNEFALEEATVSAVNVTNANPGRLETRLGLFKRIARVFARQDSIAKLEARPLRSTSAADRTYTALEVQVDRIWSLTDFTP